MAVELIYNISDRPLFVNYDGRSIIIQPKGNGKYEFRRFGVAEGPPSAEDEKAGLFFVEPDTGEKRRVIPREEYRKGDYPKVVYGLDPEKAITKRLPRYCQLPIRISDEPQDGCVEVSTTVAAFACSAEFERRVGARCYRGSEIAKMLRAENADLQARNAELLAREAKVAELEAKLAAAEKKSKASSKE